jgi:hypothetical protein
MGKPVRAIAIHWAVSGGGHANPSQSVTDTAGRATTSITLGTVAGVDTITASANGTTPVVFLATAVPGPITRLSLGANAVPALGPVGDTALLQPTASDQFGNAVIGYGNYRWYSSDTSVATVDSYGANVPGLVHAAAPGTATITVTTGPLSAHTTVTVLGFTSVTVGSGQICGTAVSGTLYCWGDNQQGDVGDGTTVARPHPTIVTAPSALTSVSAGMATCGLDAAGFAYCWGPNGDGELGDGTSAYATEAFLDSPTPVVGGLSFSSISVGDAFACGVTPAHAAYCWGANDIGELGIDTLTSTCIDNAINRCSNTPLLVAGSLQFASVSAGSWEHACGLTTTGAAYCWGSDGNGELGNTSTTQMCGVPAPGYACSHTPLPVQGGITFISVNTGGYDTCGLGTDHAAYCWGFHANGTTNTAVPFAVPGGLTFTVLQAGRWGYCGLVAGGTAYCWQSGYAPVAVEGAIQFVALGIGQEPCGIAANHALYCWTNDPSSGARTAPHARQRGFRRAPSSGMIATSR